MSTGPGGFVADVSEGRYQVGEDESSNTAMRVHCEAVPIRFILLDTVLKKVDALAIG